MGTVLGFDQGMEALTGWPAMAVVGRPKQHCARVENLSTKDDLVGHHDLPLYDGTLDLEDAASGLREIRFNCSDGSAVLVEARVGKLPGPGDRIQVDVRRVLARSAAVPVRGTAGCDRLTGLLDRGSFLQHLDRCFATSAARARPLALIVADVDHLRGINDRYGREKGDDVLRKLAGILRVTVEKEENLGRLGPDEFGIVLPEAGRGDARQVAASLRTTVERFRFFGYGKTQEAGSPTLSIGAASFPADAENPRALVDRATDALNEARALGRNRVWCYVRRPRVPLEVPVYFDAAESLLVGYSRDLSPSGLFVQTSAPLEIGMRCALAFPLPGMGSKVHVIGRVVRAVPQRPDAGSVSVPGMGVEFERFGGPQDQQAIESFLHHNESNSLRPENGELSLG